MHVRMYVCKCELTHTYECAPVRVFACTYVCMCVSYVYHFIPSLQQLVIPPNVQCVSASCSQHTQPLPLLLHISLSLPLQINPTYNFALPNINRTKKTHTHTHTYVHTCVMMAISVHGGKASSLSLPLLLFLFLSPFICNQLTGEPYTCTYVHVQVCIYMCTVHTYVHSPLIIYT